MFTYVCADCGNNDNFCHSYRGLYCPDCGGTNVRQVMAAPQPDYVRGVDFAESLQVQELERMFKFRDDREEKRPAQGSLWPEGGTDAMAA